MSELKAMLVPFDVKTQKFLKDTDTVCIDYSDKFKEAFAAIHNGEAPEMALTEDDMIFMNVIMAFGMLYNRCVEAGWIEDVVLNK